MQIRAVNDLGDGTPTTSISATPRTIPSAPDITGITPGSGELSVAFIGPSSNGGSAIINYKYSTDGGTSFTTRSPAATTSPILIPGLINGTTYDVQIKAVNAAGDGAASVSTSGTPVALPELAVSPSSLTGFTYASGSGPSTSQSFNITGTALTGAPDVLTVTGSTNYEVSNDDTTFGPTATLPYTSETLGSTPVYVRLKAGLAIGSYNSETITGVGGGATAPNVTVSGSVTLANDLSSNATVLTVNAAAMTGTMVGATVSSPFTGNVDVWYQFTPAVTGTATITTANNGQDLDLLVWSTTPPVATSGSVASSTAGGTTSETVSLSVTAGVPYYIRVLRFSGTVATFTIGVTIIEASPSLTAAAGATVDVPFNVTFLDNSTWRSAISSITVGGTPLDPVAYSTTTEGQITFTPSASTLLQTAGSKAIVVIATGYSNATVSQSIVAGAATKLGVTTQPTAPTVNGGAFAAQPVVRIQDQYGNTTTNTADVVADVGAGTWILGGTTTRTAAAGTATFTGLTATSEAAVTGATITFTSGSLTSATSAPFNIHAPVLDYIDLTALGTPATENFDGMAATLNLPAGWKMGASTSSPTWSGAATTVTQQASSGSPTAGGTYNWGSSASERAVGAMTSGSFGSPNNLLVKVRNNTGSIFKVLAIDYKAERYRINSAAASVSLFYSLDGTTWTSVSGGDIATESFPTGSSSYNFTSGTTVSKSGVTQSGLSVVNGAFFYLRWNINTTGGSSQGIGIDDVSITGEASIYSYWAKGFPGFTDTATTSDPDNDLYNNLIEFAFGTNPTTSTSGSPITYANGVVTATGQPTVFIGNIANGVDFRAVLGRRKDYVNAGLTYKVQFSADLNYAAGFYEEVTVTEVNSTVLATDGTIDAVSIAYPLYVQTSRGFEKPTFFRVAVSSN